ncbi:MAG: hypothetical protein CMO55_25285 [Verrucomicrobiales bacterium]|nr:hypothetical protein [Verrucomicrobiales bacterium]
MSRQYLVNVHIPKCGGTTFLEVLQRNFGNRYDCSYGHIWREFYTAEQIQKFIVSDLRFEAFSSHEISLDLPFNSEIIDLVCTVSLRDPLQRCVSHYFFERQRGTTKFKDVLTLSLNGFLEEILNHDDHWLFDYQTKHLVKNTSFKGAADIIKFAGTARIFPIVLERFSESMVSLEQRLPHWFSDCSFTPTNQSKHTEHADAELTAEFCKRSSQDAKLLEWANGTLDEFVTQDPDAHQLLVARFNKRCRKLARRNAIFDKLRGFARWNRNLMLNR